MPTIYLWAISEALQAEVRPNVDSELARESLANCVRVLTALGNALEAGSQRDIPPEGTSLMAPHTENLRTVNGPPESPALCGNNWSIVEALAKAIDNDSLAAQEVQRSVHWERQQMDAANERMDSCLSSGEHPAANPAMQIDPKKLQAYLRRVTGVPSLGIESFRVATGGRSRQTVLLTITPGSELPQALVVQRPAPGMNHGSAFNGPAVEFRILDTLYRAGLKVPRPLLLETNSEALGAPFVIVEQDSGSLVDADYWAPRATRPVALDLARQMAKLH